jgi:hypothetical protein
MPVSDQKVLKKMMGEIQKAQDDQYDPSKLKEHIRAIRLLCDLFLEDESTTSEEVVLQKMKEQEQRNQDHTYRQKEEQKPIDHDDANGSSIFDF